MEEGRKGKGLKGIVEAIQSSEGWETRISLLDQLEDSHTFEAYDAAFLIECLPVLWEDSTCLGISQCKLNRKLLSVATKFFEINISVSLTHFVILGTKASIWCQKHLEIKLESLDKPFEEDHSTALSELVLDSLRFSSAMIASLMEPICFKEKARLLIVENFIIEQLNLTRVSVSKIKGFQHMSSEIIKAAQAIVEITTKLCKSYFESTYSKSDEMIKIGKDYEDEIKVHVITVTTITIENLHKLGILAAAGGGLLVTILNVSWKGVVSLLQLGKKVVSCKIKIAEILRTLISLASEFLSRAAEAWFDASPKSVISLTEVKRAFLPIKFYLINAIRISSDHPHEAMEVCGEIVKCVFLVPYFGVLFAREVSLRAASEGLVDILEPTSFLLLHGILSSNDVAVEYKSQILDSILKDKNKLCTTIPSRNDASISGVIALGQIMIFLHILKSSAAFRDEVISLIAKNLGDLMNCLVEDDVYPLIFILHVPVCGSGTNKGISWKPVMDFLLHSLKIFMISAKSSFIVEEFLQENLFHPHCLVQEIVLEMWCFFVRHVEPGVSNDIFNLWFFLFKSLAPSETALKPLSPLRRFARSISRILSHAPQSTVDHVYNSMFDDAGSVMLPSIVPVAVMMEGFPLNSLSSNLKIKASRSILENFHRFLEDYGNRHDGGSFAIHAFACALRSSLITDYDIIEDSISRLLRFSLHLFREHKNESDERLLSTALDIISRVRKSYAMHEIRDIVRQLHTLSLSTNLKPTLVSFAAGLCCMEMRESDEDPTYSAAWSLYHTILRERSWAFLHLSLDGFGYFAARTPCTQLWRFVPEDAALSYDVDTGKEPSEDRFMGQLKAFLERETTSCDQFDDLRREAAALRQKILDTEEEMREKRTRENERKRKRKMPEEISKGLSMLQGGIDLLNKGLLSNDGVDLSQEFSGQLSSLQGLILGLRNLADP